MKHVIDKLKTLFPERLHDRILLVGGMVRDILLGAECQDVDLVAVAAPSELTAVGFRLVESTSTPNIYFRFHKELGKVEITLLSSFDELPEDLRRRDFTANAMAMTLDGSIQDPLDGRQDLEKKALRMCGATSFKDDPARIFRALRFECEGWRLDADAEAAIRARDWADAFAAVPVERFANEMLKGLAKDDPGRFFQRMLEFRVGQRYLPEIFTMPEVPAGPLQHHPEGDLFTHSMQALERMSLKSPEVKARFCALFHDLGKLATPAEEYPKHHGHEVAGAQAANDFCRKLRLPVSLLRALQATCRLHGNGNRWQELRDSTKIDVALAALKGGIEEILPLVVEADSGGAMPGWEVAVQVASMKATQLGIDPALFNAPGFPPEKCQQIITQRRVELLRERMKVEKSNPPAPRFIKGGTS